MNYSEVLEKLTTFHVFFASRHADAWLWSLTKTAERTLGPLALYTSHDLGVLPGPYEGAMYFYIRRGLVPIAALAKAIGEEPARLNAPSVLSLQQLPMWKRQARLPSPTVADIGTA